MLGLNEFYCHRRTSVEYTVRKSPSPIIGQALRVRDEQAAKRHVNRTEQVGTRRDSQSNYPIMPPDGRAELR